MKFVVLRRRPDDLWERLRVVDVPTEAEEVTPALVLAAVEQGATDAGVYLAVPFDLWMLCEVQTRVSVQLVPVAPSGGVGPERQPPVVPDARGYEEFQSDVPDEEAPQLSDDGAFEELDGMRRPRARP